MCLKGNACYPSLTFELSLFITFTIYIAHIFFYQYKNRNFLTTGICPDFITLSLNVINNAALHVFFLDLILKIAEKQGQAGRSRRRFKKNTFFLILTFFIYFLS